MKTTCKIFFVRLFCLALPLLSGCGDGVPSLTVEQLTPAEKAEVDKFITEHGRDALAHYIDTTRKKGSRDWKENEKLILKYVKYLISQGANVDAKSEWGDTPLRMAVLFKDIEVVKFLVSKGADVNAKYFVSERTYAVNESTAKHNEEYNGETPLHLAARLRDTDEIVKFLVSKGADVNAKNRNGWTPFDVARDTSVAEYLSSKGAKPGK